MVIVSVQITDNEGAVVNLEGQGNTTMLIETDHDAIGKAFDFGDDALDSVDNTVNNTVNKAFEFGGDALDIDIEVCERQ